MTRVSLLCACLLTVGVVGCKSADAPAPLVKASQVSSDETCPAGGSLIEVGVDVNGNGALDADEVTQSKEICNGAVGPTGAAGATGDAGSNGAAGMNGADGGSGASGAPLFVSSVSIGVGDTQCPQGGVRLDFGFDDGRGNGVANDGVLQPGEVTGSRVVCNGQTPRYEGSTTPPAGDAGPNVIDTTGSSGDGGGGSGGDISIAIANGTLGGNVRVFATGSLDAGFTLPNVAFVPGQYPLQVTGTLRLESYDDDLAAEEASAAMYIHTTSNLVHIIDGGIDVTSIDVQPGAKLVLTSSVTVRNGFRNAGTVTDDSLALVGVRINAGDFFGEPGSMLIAEGTDGGLTTTTSTSGRDIFVGASRNLINQGAISTRGGSGNNGSSGGEVTLLARIGELYSTGTITTTGGDADGSFYGGHGGRVTLEGQHRGVYAAGTITTGGGAGGLGSGSGGYVLMQAGGGQLRSVGSISTVPKSCTQAACRGGAAGDVELHADDGPLMSTGVIVADGSGGLVAGGRGGTVTIRVGSYTSVYDLSPQQNFGGNSSPVPAGSLVVAGSVFARGGAGVQGGSGGRVEIELDPDSIPQGQELTLYGFGWLRCDGGSGGAAQGGSGCMVTLRNQLTYTAGQYLATGGVVLSSEVTARGGSGFGHGGPGGSLYAYVPANQDLHEPSMVVRVLSNSIDLSAGAVTGGTGAAGSAGTARFEATWAVENRAAINLNGGASTAATATPSGGGYLELSCPFGELTNVGALTAAGGAGGALAGAGGGSLSLMGKTVTNTGGLSVPGGTSTITGGAGGEIWLASSSGAGTVTSGAVDVKGGTGAPQGPKGQVVVDGNDVTP